MSTWSVKFPVYQIDFAAEAAGKRVASTKRKIRWRFGYPNKDALADGRTGTDCRGEEHEVTVLWSITSGKRQVAMDGREIHFSSSRAGTLDFSWTTKGNHVVKVICYAAAPLSPTPGFRQYDLLIDGQSFFAMPKLFQIGINDPNAGRGARAYGGYANPPNAVSPVSLDSGYPGASAQEEADLRRAIQASLAESRRHLEKGSSSTNGNGNAPTRGQSMDGDLLGFDSPPPSVGGPPSFAPGSDAPSVSGVSYYSAPPTYSHQPAYASPPPYQVPPQTPVGPGALVPMHGPPGSGYYQAPPPTTPAYGSPPPGPPPPTPSSAQSYYGAPPPQNYASAPPPQGAPFGFNSSPYEDPFAPKPPPPPPAQDLATLVMGAYQSGPTPTTPMATGGPPGNQNGWPYSPQENVGGPPPQGLSMSTLAITEHEEAPVDALTKAMRNLVNFDHIDEPAEGELKLTMVKKEAEKKKMAKGKSIPLPPVGSTLVGTGASLSQIKQVQHGERTLKSSTDGVMQAPPPGAYAPGANTGALVVFGQGPPPLHQPQGFGLGARLPNGGFSHQQQSPPMGYQQQQQYR